MPRFKLVIDNADLAHEKEIERNVRANMKAHGVEKMAAHDAARTTNVINREVRKRFPEARPAGEVHDIADTECPDGMPNCRNCGDPNHAASCQAAGHCPKCGTAHGIAPDRIVSENGYRLEPV
jgi:hypothetical protein